MQKKQYLVQYQKYEDDDVKTYSQILELTDKELKSLQEALKIQEQLSCKFRTFHIVSIGESIDNLVERVSIPDHIHVRVDDILEDKIRMVSDNSDNDPRDYWFSSTIFDDKDKNIGIDISTFHPGIDMAQVSKWVNDIKKGHHITILENRKESYPYESSMLLFNLPVVNSKSSYDDLEYLISKTIVHNIDMLIRNKFNGKVDNLISMNYSFAFVPEYPVKYKKTTIFGLNKD